MEKTSEKTSEDKPTEKSLPGSHCQEISLGIFDVRS
jgi:hypothetical protein